MQNILGAPGTTAAGIAAAAGVYTALTQLVPGEAGQIIGGITAAVIILVGALAPTFAQLRGTPSKV